MAQSAIRASHPYAVARKVHSTRQWDSTCTRENVDRMVARGGFTIRSAVIRESENPFY
jgi:hypothetical protein